MKAIRKIDLLKAIAFMVVVFFCISCDPRDEPVILKPVITIGEAENITLSSATLVATVVPNGDNVPVFFTYKETANSTWITAKVTTTFSGNTSSKVTLNVSGLQPGVKYDFKADAGTESSTINTFTTTASSVIKIGTAQNVKISTAKLTATVIPNSNNVLVSFEYQTTSSAWVSKPIAANFSGKDSIKVTLDLSDLQANTVYKFRLKAGDRTSDESSFKTYAVADYDGNYYHTVTIGNQTWLQENLKTTHFANGDPIPNVTNATTWSTLTTPAYCYYNNDAKNGEVYGALYNWYVAHDSRGLIVGYHVPTEKEFLAPAYFLAGNPADIALAYNPSLSDVTVMMMEAGNTHWSGPKRLGTNSSGFTAIANGGFTPDRISDKFVFTDLNECAIWWENEEFNTYGLVSQIDQSLGYLSTSGCARKTLGLGIRLVK